MPVIHTCKVLHMSKLYAGASVIETRGLKLIRKYVTKIRKTTYVHYKSISTYISNGFHDF